MGGEEELGFSYEKMHEKGISDMRMRSENGDFISEPELTVISTRCQDSVAGGAYELERACKSKDGKRNMKVDSVSFITYGEMQELAVTLLPVDELGEIEEGLEESPYVMSYSCGDISGDKPRIEKDIEIVGSNLGRKSTLIDLREAEVISLRLLQDAAMRSFQLGEMVNHEEFGVCKIIGFAVQTSASERANGAVLEDKNGRIIGADFQEIEMIIE